MSFASNDFGLFQRGIHGDAKRELRAVLAAVFGWIVPRSVTGGQFAKAFAIRVTTG